MVHVLPRKGGWVRDERRWCAKQDWAPYQHPQTLPRPHRFFFSVPSPPPARSGFTFPRGQTNLLFRSSCFNVLGCSTPSSRDPPPSFLPIPAGVSVHMPATFERPRERAPIFHSPRNEPPKRQLIFQETTSASAVTPRHLYALYICSFVHFGMIVQNFISQLERLFVACKSNIVFFYEFLRSYTACFFIFIRLVFIERVFSSQL